MTVDTKKLRKLAEAATQDADAEWAYIDGPLMGDIAVDTKPSRPSATFRLLRVGPGTVGPFIAAANPQAVIALLDEIERLRDDEATMKLSRMVGLGDPVRPDIHNATLRQLEREKTRAIHLEQQLAAANAEIERLREETLRLGTHSNLHEVREKQATEMCTWLTSENQRLRDALKLAEHLDGEMDDLLEQSEEDVVENAQLQTQLAAMTKARDEACEIATWLAGHPSMDCLALGTKKARIATLRKVGT
jgi:DNA repair exonuclease SbcCD ATPase subunit